jgi:hypothetical protein
MGMKFADPRLIDDHRGTHEYQAYVPPPVKTGRIPRWLAAKVRRAYPRPAFERHRGWEVDALQNDNTFRCAAWLDHWGTSTWKGHEIFVAEPIRSGSTRCAPSPRSATATPWPCASPPAAGITRRPASASSSLRPIRAPGDSGSFRSMSRKRSSGPANDRRRPPSAFRTPSAMGAGGRPRARSIARIRTGR